MLSVTYYELAVLGALEMLILLGWIILRFARGRLTRELFYMALLGFVLLFLIPIAFLLNSRTLSIVIWMAFPPYIGAFSILAERQRSDH